MANGIPSSRVQISTTGPATSAWSTENSGDTACARSTNRVTAVELIPAPTSSVGTGHTCSSATARASRLVANTRTVAERARITSIRSAAASSTCSQLSITNRRTRPSGAPATDSLTDVSACRVTPSTVATASGRAARSLIAASSNTQMPSGNSSSSCAATASARRVLPTPPTPVSVTSRWALTAAWISARSDSRPINPATAARRLPALGFRARRPGNSSRRPAART